MSLDRRFRSILIAISAICSPAAAQDLGGALDLGQLGASMGVNNAIRAHVARSKTTPRAPAPRQRATAARPSLSFTPSIERRRKNLAQFVSRSRARDPQGAAKMEKLFASHDIIEQANYLLTGYGLQPNNVADAYTVWWLNAWLASHGRSDDPTRQQIQAVRAQAVQAMSTLPAMRSASEATRQEMTEAYLVQATLIGAYMGQAKTDPALRARVQDAVRQGARASGLDLDAIELTDSGFVPA